MTLRGNDLILTVLGLLAIGLAGTEASAGIPQQGASSSCQYYHVGCQTTGCEKVTAGSCSPPGSSQVFPYNAIMQSGGQVGTCYQSTNPLNSCTSISVFSCGVVRYNLTTQWPKCGARNDTGCSDSSYTSGC